jgi:hypothetical protein
MEHQRIEVTSKQLSTAIAVWLRHIPKRVWEQWIEHRIFQHYKRQSMSVERLNAEVADHIATEIDRHGWKVTHPAPMHPGSPPAWISAPTASRPDQGQAGKHSPGS